MGQLARADKTLRHVGLTISQEKHAALETKAIALGLSLQKTVESVLDKFLADSGVVLPAIPKPPRQPRRGSAAEQYELIAEKLQLLENGQGTILQVLGRIAGSTPNQGSIESLDQQAHDNLDERSPADREVLRRASELIAQHPGGSKYFAPAKKARPRKPGKATGADPGRRKGGTG